MRDVTMLHPLLQERIGKLQILCQQKGIIIGISEGLRTIEEQNALYAKGRTTPGPVVTNARGDTYSNQHQWGIACDFYLDMDVDMDGSKGDDAFNNTTGLFERVGALAKTVGLSWGGDWKNFVDRPHLYLGDWGSTATQLKKEYKTPEKFFATWSGGGNLANRISNQTSATGYTIKNFIYDIQVAEGQSGKALDSKAGTITLRLTPTVSRYKNKNHTVVTPLERRLKELGYYTGKIEADEGKRPIFGKGMETAVNRYQKEVLKYRKTDGEITARKRMWKSLLGME